MEAEMVGIGREFSSTREFLSLGALRAMGQHPGSSSASYRIARARDPVPKKAKKKAKKVVKLIIRSMVRIFSFSSCGLYKNSFSSSCSWTCRVTGTLFGYRRGKAHFAVQEGPRSAPIAVLELPILTNSLVKEMAYGLVRIALECPKGNAEKDCNVQLLMETRWSMYCNGRKAGYASRRNCCEWDLKVLGLFQAVSMGAGVLPIDEESEHGDGEGELMYMRASFHRVVGSRDSEAFYMINPDGLGGPELSIFLLRI